MNIIILGSPASGKGTQAALVAKKYNLYYLQTGDLSRKLAEKDERINKIVNSGMLIPQEEMTLYVMDHLKEIKNDLQNILFEGFPRFVSQYEALENFLVSKGSNIDLTLSIDVSKQEAVKRMTARRICKVCKKVFNLITNPPAQDGRCACGGELIQRDDDNPKSIETRFDYYEKNTKELIDFLEEKNKLTRVNGEKPIDEVFSDIVNIIEKINA